MNAPRPGTDDPRLTAYALGELPAAECAAVESALQDDPDLRRTVADIRATAATLTAVLAEETPVPATSAGRTTSSSLARRPPRRGRLLAFPQLYYLAGGLAAAAFAVVVALYRDTFDEREQLRTATLRRALSVRSGGDLLTLALPVVPPADPADKAPEVDNPFRTTDRSPHSTFAAEVDTVSYARVRRVLGEHQLPPATAVRIEELLNYFSYHYPPPDAAAAPVAADLEVAAAPWAPGHRLVRIGLKGRAVAAADRAAAHLVLLIDTSASMDAADRLPLVKASIRLLLAELRADDRVTLVNLADSARPVLAPTPVAERTRIFAALDALAPGGTPQGADSFRLAYDLAREHFTAAGLNRLVLCTDGGLALDRARSAELLDLATERARENVFLTVLGFGRDGLQDPLLERLAERGNGHFGFIASQREARKQLMDEVTSQLAASACDLTIRVEFNPALVASYRLIGYEGAAAPGEFLPTEAAALGSGQEVTALYEVVPVANPRTTTPPAASGGVLLTVELRYREPSGRPERTLAFPLVDRGTAFAAASTDFRFAAAVAEFGMILRRSPHRGSSTLRDVLAWASDATRHPVEDPDGHRAEFVDLVRRAQSLME